MEVDTGSKHTSLKNFDKLKLNVEIQQSNNRFQPYLGGGYWKRES
jgi:hypothetical protein